MKDVWSRIEKLVRTETPDVLQGLRPGARNKAIAETERALGVTFPSDIQESFRIHDGQKPQSPEILDGWEFLPLSGVIHEWTMWKQLSDGGEFKGQRSETSKHHAEDWWNPAWIPLASNGGGDYHCVDLAPSPKGKLGQIILMQHDSPERPLVADSFREWLMALADDLQANQTIVGSKKPKLDSHDVPSMATLIALIERSIKDADVQTFLKTQPVEKAGPFLDNYFLCSKPRGFSIEYEKKGRITTVFVYVAPNEGYTAFSGLLLAGLTSEDGYTEVRKVLGAPTRSRNFADDVPQPVVARDIFNHDKAALNVQYFRDRKGIKMIVASAIT